MNITGVNLEGKTVLVKKSFFKPAYRELDRRFKCSGGFGCDPDAMGRAVFGEFLLDGEHARIERSDVECVLEEIAN